MKTTTDQPTARPGDLIRARLGERGISQSELARRLGKSKFYVANILAGRRSIRAQAAALAELLDLPVADLLRLQDDWDRHVADAVQLRRLQNRIRARLGDVDHALAELSRLAGTYGRLQRDQQRAAAAASVAQSASSDRTAWAARSAKW